MSCGIVGGTITIESALDAGTAFTVELPVQAAESLAWTSGAERRAQDAHHPPLHPA